MTNRAREIGKGNALRRSPPQRQVSRSRRRLLLALESQLRALGRGVGVQDGIGERRRDLGGYEIPGLVHLADLVAVLGLLDEIERKRSLAVGDGAEDAQTEVIGDPDHFGLRIFRAVSD